MNGFFPLFKKELRTLIVLFIICAVVLSTFPFILFFDPQYNSYKLYQNEILTGHLAVLFFFIELASLRTYAGEKRSVFFLRRLPVHPITIGLAKLSSVLLFTVAGLLMITVIHLLLYRELSNGLPFWYFLIFLPEAVFPGILISIFSKSSLDAFCFLCGLSFLVLLILNFIVTGFHTVFDLNENRLFWLGVQFRFFMLTIYCYLFWRWTPRWFKMQEQSDYAGRFETVSNNSFNTLSSDSFNSPIKSADFRLAHRSEAAADSGSAERSKTPVIPETADLIGTDAISDVNYPPPENEFWTLFHFAHSRHNWSTRFFIILTGIFFLLQYFSGFFHILSIAASFLFIIIISVIYQDILQSFPTEEKYRFLNRIGCSPKILFLSSLLSSLLIYYSRLGILCLGGISVTFFTDFVILENYQSFNFSASGFLWIFTFLFITSAAIFSGGICFITSCAIGMFRTIFLTIPSFLLACLSGIGHLNTENVWYLFGILLFIVIIWPLLTYFNMKKSLTLR